MIARVLAACLLLAASLGARAQVVPAFNFTDMWWNPAESGWGISVVQKVPQGGTIDTLYAIWYVYDPRTLDATNPGGYAALWLPMSNGRWITSTTYQLSIYVTKGTNFTQAWNPSDLSIPQTPIGTATFNWTDANNGTFTYSIQAQTGVASTDPRFGLPAMSGTKTITRQVF